MAAGLTVYNSANTIQIDENYRNLMVLNSGWNGTPTASGISWPLCAIRSTSLALAYTLTSTSSVSYTVVGGGSGYNWYVFDLANTPVSSVGLHVYNASGQLVYDSGRNPMRIVDYLVFNSEAEFNGATRTYPAGRTYAVIIGKYASKFISQSLNRDACGWEIQQDWYYSGARVNNNVVTFGWIQVRSDLLECEPDTQDYTRLSPRMEAIVVDVTNF